MIAYDEFVQVEEGSHVFTVFTDIDKLETHMKALFPADAEAIEGLINAARRFTDLELFSLPVAGPGGFIRALKFASALMKWARISLRDYATRFKDPFLRKAFPLVLYDFEGVPMLGLLTFLAWMHKRDLGWPEGGSLEFSKAIASRYQELGGVLHYNSRVTTILVEGGRAVGVGLVDGTEHRADVVISNADDL